MLDVLRKNVVGSGMDFAACNGAGNSAAPCFLLSAQCSFSSPTLREGSAFSEEHDLQQEKSGWLAGVATQPSAIMVSQASHVIILHSLYRLYLVIRLHMCGVDMCDSIQYRGKESTTKLPVSRYPHAISSSTFVDDDMDFFPFSSRERCTSNFQRQKV